MRAKDNTDVAGSINGYYKQIYLAIKELLKLKEDNSSVGIECGADIRIFKSNNMNESIEVKFYKKNIGVYSPEISKTIYNFYNQTADDRVLYFNTNTKVPSTNIFEKNGEIFRLNKDNGISYILHLLIKHEAKKGKANNIREYFEKIGVICNKCTEGTCDNCISEFVKQFESQYPSHFDKLIKINSSVSLPEFIVKLHFIFENEPKDKSIALLKNELKSLLKENYNDLVSEFGEIILEAIIHKIAMEFFDSTVINSLIKNPNIDYKTHKRVSKSDVKQFISTYQTFFDDYKEDVLELKIFDIVENSNLNEQKILLKFNKEYEEYLVSENDLEEYNQATIKKYFKDNGLKFKSEDERDKIANRFELYKKGFGLIAYLMNLKVREISVKENIVFLKGIDDEHLSIENNGYYDFGTISTYLDIDENKKSGNEFYKYAEIEDCSFLECISDACETPYILIDKLEKEISLEEYQMLNNIPVDVVEEIKNLVSSNKNILIISPAPMYKKPFLNAMIKSIPRNISFYTIAEDLHSLPTICRRNSVVIADSFKSDYYQNVQNIPFGFGGYDKCISLIDNYSLDPIEIFNNSKGLLEKNKSVIATLHRVVRDYKSFDEICKSLSILDGIDYSIFDAFILLDNYYVNEIKQDVVKIFNKVQV